MVRISVPKLPTEYLKITTNTIINSNSNDFDDNELVVDAKLFIFDKDGTLLTHNHFVPILKKRLELITDKFKISQEDLASLALLLGLNPDTDEIIPGGTMFIARKDSQLLIETFLKDRIRSRVKVHSLVNQIFQDADVMVDLDKHVQPFPDVPDFLKQLKEHDVKIAIATHDTTAAAMNQLAAADIDRYLDIIIGLDYSENILHKPAPAMLNTACSEFNISPKDSVVVGDSINDVLMGISGGAGLSVGVLTGEHKFQDFKEYDALITSISDCRIIE